MMISPRTHGRTNVPTAACPDYGPIPARSPEAAEYRIKHEPGWRRGPASLGDAINLRNHRLGAQLRDDGVEVLEVVDLEIDHERGEIGRLPLHADVVDVAVVLGDPLGDLGERAGLVDRLHGEPRRETVRRRLVHVPAHVEPALGRVLVVLQRRGLDRVDRDPLARRHDTDDAVARHGPTIGREAHWQVAIDAADRNTLGGPARPPYPPPPPPPPPQPTPPP